MTETEKALKHIRTKMVLVTPKKAAEWLKHNTRNRNYNESHVAKLSSDMENGRWMITHQGAAFNCDGTLLDGQHTLMAIVKSNTSQWMLVTNGLPAESVAAIDDHLKRSTADSLKIVHGKSIPNMNRAVAAAVYLAVAGGNASKAYKSRQAQMGVFLKHEKAITWAIEAYPTAMRGLCKASILGVIARAYYTQDRDRVKRFCEILMDPSKARSEADRQIGQFRDWIMTKSSGGGQGLREVYLKTEKLLHSWLHGKKSSRLVAATEEMFPVPGEALAA